MTLANSSRAVSSRRPKILVIDDSRLIRMAAQKILAQDYDVVLAEDGEQGWQEINQDDSFQIVFSDLTMPRLDGFALLKRIRQSSDQRLKNIPLIIMTTETDDENRRETALQLGATDFISKPFNSIDLKARAKAHVTSEEITRELKRKADLLEHNAHRDALTGLNNRSYLMEKLWQDCSYSIRHDKPVSLLRMDIDAFNQYFVQHGKSFANEVIKKIASIISLNLRSEDTAARIGLSTFIVVRPGSDTEASVVAASQIREQVQSTIFKLGEQLISVTLLTAVFTPFLTSDFNINDLLTKLDKLVLYSIDRTENNGPASSEIVYEDAWTMAQQQALVQACQLPGFDEALKLLARGEKDKVIACLPQMLIKLKPLFELADEKQIQDFISSLAFVGVGPQ
ncbi:hypothetical protein MNBD_GAMMA12-1127 [hydrothermal vent metagenome]|uniref:Uncharacterized protein n=1 Tax=hydrothermal vent metagenome TaxID=652676 RepID=A0A3B0Y885_9ZZZZ